jgi:hypothetical protein
MGVRKREGIGSSYRPTRQHRLAESIPWNRFLGIDSPRLFKSLKYQYTVLAQFNTLSIFFISWIFILTTWRCKTKKVQQNLCFILIFILLFTFFASRALNGVRSFDPCSFPAGMSLAIVLVEVLHLPRVSYPRNSDINFTLRLNINYRQRADPGSRAFLTHRSGSVISFIRITVLGYPTHISEQLVRIFLG